jgi:hypothetical protein
MELRSYPHIERSTKWLSGLLSKRLAIFDVFVNEKVKRGFCLTCPVDLRQQQIVYMKHLHKKVAVIEFDRSLKTSIGECFHIKFLSSR